MATRQSVLGFGQSLQMLLQALAAQRQQEQFQQALQGATTRTPQFTGLNPAQGTITPQGNYGVPQVVEGQRLNRGELANPPLQTNIDWQKLVQNTGQNPNLAPFLQQEAQVKALTAPQFITTPQGGITTDVTGQHKPIVNPKAVEDPMLVKARTAIAKSNLTDESYTNLLDYIAKRSSGDMKTPFPKIESSSTSGGSWQKIPDAMGNVKQLFNPTTKETINLGDYGLKIEGPTTGTTKTMIETAPKVKSLVDKAIAGLDKVGNDLGPIEGRWSDFFTGKVGTKNPDYMSLRTNVGLLSTLLMRMHVGARGSQQIMEKFDNMIGLAKQDPENMRATLEAIRSYADDVSGKHDNTNAQETKTLDGKTYVKINGEWYEQ